MSANEATNYANAKGQVLNKTGSRPNSNKVTATKTWQYYHIHICLAKDENGTC